MDFILPPAPLSRCHSARSPQQLNPSLQRRGKGRRTLGGGDDGSKVLPIISPRLALIFNGLSDGEAPTSSSRETQPGMVGNGRKSNHISRHSIGSTIAYRYAWWPPAAPLGWWCEWPYFGTRQEIIGRRRKIVPISSTVVSSSNHRFILAPDIRGAAASLGENVCIT